MPYVSATFVADLPTMSDRRDQQCPENFLIPLYSLLPLYTVFFLPLKTNYPPLAYDSLVSPPEHKSISPFSRMP